MAEDPVDNVICEMSVQRPCGNKICEKGFIRNDGTERCDLRRPESPKEEEVLQHMAATFCKG